MSRRFALVKPEVLWTGTVAREMRKHPADVRELAAYLLTGPTSETWGIWHMELDTMVLQTGRKEPNVLKALAALQELRFAFYDIGTQFVWVPDMPSSQFSRWPLMPNDNNVRHAKRWYAALPVNPFLGDWFDHHLIDLHLDSEPEPVERRALQGAPPAPSEGPSPSPSPGFDLLGEKKDLPARTRPQAMTAGDLDTWFERIAAVYPKQVKLAKARAAMAKLKPTAELMVQIWSALEWQCQQRDWLKEGGHYAPSLYNYFTDRRWLDRRPNVQHFNKGTAAIVGGINDFVNDAPDLEPECRILPRNVRALPPRSAK